MFGTRRADNPNTSAFFLVLALVGATACSDSTGAGNARLTVVLSDAPHPYFESVAVSLGTVEIIPTSGPPVTVTDARGDFDLLTLQDGVTATLGSIDVPPANYRQLRMVVTAASVTLKDGLQFVDGSVNEDLVVPSGALTGIKINLDDADGVVDGAGVEIRSGETILVVDFDVTQNFKIQGAVGTPAEIQRVIFTPLLRAAVSNIAASISGTVTDADGAAVVGVTVKAELIDSGVMEELQTNEATALTAADGTYTLRFLSPGSYTVSVDTTGVSVNPPSLVVVVGDSVDVGGIDFVIGS